jgi:predicted Rossmann fold nucleotide-binding protein DprA/Smf involved in DNA uptake
MKDYLHGFQVITGANVRWVRKIWEFFDDFQWAWEKAGVRDFVDAGLSVKSAEKLFFERGKIVLEREIENLYSKKISLVSCFEKSYPEMLRDIEDRPFLLYVLGDYEKVFQRRMISIVGSRMPSEYGREMTYVLSEKILDGGVFRRVAQAATAGQLERGQDGHAYVFGVDWGKSNDCIYNLRYSEEGNME